MRWKRWNYWVAGAALVAGACRSHVAVCEGESCVVEEPPPGGPAGAGAGDGDGGEPGSSEAVPGGAGAGGADATCANDAACDNGLACDGLERCTDSGCEPGEPLSCEGGTICVEESAECVYRESSPWLIIAAVDRLLGLPVGLIGREPLVELATHPRVDVWTGFEDVSWSPDGSVLIARAVEVQLGYSYSFARFGAGLPSAFARLPEFPSWSAGPEWIDAFSPDSRFFFKFDVDARGFLYDLRAADLDPRALSASHVDFCAERSTWLADDEVQTLVDGEIVSRALPAGSKTLSPDRRLIAVERLDEEGDAIGMTITPCGMEDWTAEVPGGFPRFSADSKALWTEVDYEDGLVSLEDPQSPVELIAAGEGGLDYEAFLSPAGEYVLAKKDDSFVLVNVRATDAPAPLGLPESAEIIALTDLGVLAWSTYEIEAPRELLWQPLSPHPTPIVLHRDPTGTDVLIRPIAGSDAWFIGVKDGGTSRLYRVDLDAEAPEAKLSLEISGTAGGWLLAPDGSGVAFGVATGELTQSAYFARFDSTGNLTKPLLLTEAGGRLSFQPWP